jgi:hypothetical protein
LKLSIKRNSTSGAKTIFLDKNSRYNGGDQERLNIILSPSYYWFKREVLPVKYVQQAQNLAPSQFDGVIDEGLYKYMAIKKEDLFWLFAYDEALIGRKLKELNIKPSQVEAFYFAQNECETLDTPVRVDDERALVSNEGVISLMPLGYVHETLSMDSCLDGVHLSKHKVSLNLFQNSVLDEKWIYRFSAVSIVFIILFLVSYLLLKNDLKEVVTQQYALTQKYKLPQTSFQLNSLRRSLTSKEDRQIALRHSIKKLFTLPLQKDEYVKKFEMKSKSAVYEIVLNTPKNAEKIKKELSKHFKITSAKVVDKTFYIGVSL